MEKKRYQVLGIEGNTVNVNGVDYAARVDVVELTDEEAAQPLAESKIALIEGEAVSETVNEEAPAEETTNGGEEAPANTEGQSAPAEEGAGGGGDSAATSEENNFQG